MIVTILVITVVYRADITKKKSQTNLISYVIYKSFFSSRQYIYFLNYFFFIIFSAFLPIRNFH